MKGEVEAMNNLQLYLAIGIPVLFNLFGFTLLSKRIDDVRTDFGGRLDRLRAEMNQRFVAVDQRFESLERLFDAKLSRVEEVMDARLKHLEEK